MKTKKTFRARIYGENMFTDDYIHWRVLEANNKEDARRMLTEKNKAIKILEIEEVKK